ncbi:MAG: tetratricopeptide repeat protein [Vicinamibacterales bacterium]
MPRARASGLGMVAIWVIVSTIATGQEVSSDAKARSEARALINAGKPREAVALLEKARGERAPAAPELVQLLGVAHYHADDYARAIELLTPVVDRLPEDSIERREAVQVLGLSLYLAGRFAESVPRLEATRAWATGNQELAYVLAQAYIQTRQPAKAREALAALFGAAPDSAAAHLLAAQMMIRLEHEALARPELERALALDPKLPRVNFLLGQMALFRGRLEEAIALTERELAINPADAVALSQLGDAYVRGSKWDQAIATLQKSIWLNPFYSAPYILMGRAYMKKDEPAMAEGMLRRAIQYDPNNRTAHYVLAQLLQQTGRLDEAKKEFAIAERLQGEPGR